MAVVDNLFCTKRLIKEYGEHGNLIIAFDFDNTIYDYHNQGLDMSEVIEELKDAHSNGLTLVCFTANNDHELVRSYVKDTLGIENVPINESPLDHLFGGRKPFFSHLLDDRAGLDSALKILRIVNKFIKAFNT